MAPEDHKEDKKSSSAKHAREDDEHADCDSERRSKPRVCPSAEIKDGDAICEGEATEYTQERDLISGEEPGFEGEGAQIRRSSEVMDSAIQEIREKIDSWTAQVSGLLEAGKTALMQAHNKWEEKVIQYPPGHKLANWLHQKQIESWEEDLEALRGLDAFNEDMCHRLVNAQAMISYVHPSATVE